MSTKTYRLLVVDDDPKLRELLRRYLSENQFEVSVAPEGATMARLMLREPFDIVVLDLMLPGEDGLSILRRLRASYGERHALLSAALEKYLPELKRGRTAAGLHILLQLPDGMSEMAVVKSAEKQNVAVYPAAPYSLDPVNTPPALLLAFSGIKPELIEPGIERLATVISELR